MRNLFTALAVFILSYTFGSVSAEAQNQTCDTHANVLKHLGDRYDEATVAAGIADNGMLLEVLSSPKGETWTIIVTRPNGPSCLFAAGNSWNTTGYKKPEDAGQKL